MSEMDFLKIESKWQKKWEKSKIFEFGDNPKNPYYVLEMFAYPSGTGLHIGHVWNYVLGDIIARYKILKGFQVLHPVGYDSLGLPAENAAIKVGIHPREYTNKSIKNFINQQKKLGLSYDWSRILSTADPNYYKWDQWIFLKMLEKGLAYQKISDVNWCSSCKTVLANEQAQGGVCDRCGTKVEVKNLKQWFLKITDYADELYNKIDSLKGWPERTKLMQKNWIGKSSGTEIDFEINGKKFPIFTTRPDTIFGVTFLVVSSRHKDLDFLVTSEQKKKVDTFLKEINSVSEKNLANLEKKGVFSGSYAVNPVNGEKVPVWIGNFVVADYGSGIVMAVPAHDKRDFEFAKKYNIPIREVVSGGNLKKSAYLGSGKLINSSNFNNLENEKAKLEITKFLVKKKVGRKVVNFRLRDWGISRQRYWGTPLPIIHCQKCGIVPVSEKDLPIKLPEEVTFGEGNPLETNEKWIEVECPKCGAKGKRETDTMDTFVNSSWYFARFCDPNNSKEIFSREKVNSWCPVDTYIGGAEHACMHLIYARFYSYFLRDLGLFEFDNFAERLFHQGMIYGEDGEKMSKSRGNTVDPLKTLEKYGVDALRFFLVSVASPEKDFPWSEKGIFGAKRFLEKLKVFSDKADFSKDSFEVLLKLNKTIKNVEIYYDSFNYRKATIELRELFEMIFDKGCSKETFGKALQILSPICPHYCEEFWNKSGNKNFISNSSWPKFKKIKENRNPLNINEKVVQNLGKVIEGLENKGQKISKVYLYFVPFEFEKADLNKIEKGLNKKVKIFSVKDPKKYDPENKSRKARPGLPGAYFE